MTGITNGTNGNQIGTATTPLLADLEALQNNGGLTQTLMPLPGSPVINKGINAALLTTDPITGNNLTDQRGLARSLGAAVDVGAVEYQLTTTTVLTTNTKTPPPAPRLT